MDRARLFASRQVSWVGWLTASVALVLTIAALLTYLLAAGTSGRVAPAEAPTRCVVLGVTVGC